MPSSVASSPRMKLCLADQAVFAGRSFGAGREVRGEVVFNTGMAGYVESLTDPSYRGQILVMTYPLQGNYGVPDGPFESGRVQVQGLVVGRYSPGYSHHTAARSLGDWLKAEGIPAIEGVDTRSLTRRLRERGTMDGWLLSEGADPAEGAGRAEGVDMTRVVDLVTSREIVRRGGGDVRILLIDTGVKESILRCLERRGAGITTAPPGAPWERCLDEADGVMLVNGPGDPSDLRPLVGRLRPLLDGPRPVFDQFIRAMVETRGSRRHERARA